jgi:signal transduction histidine kinase
MWLALGLLGLGLIAAAVVQVMIGLAPLERLQRELAAVRDGKAQLMSGGYPAEVSPLVGEFNRVLQQNAEIVERARTAAGNLAHALKTPLTVMANAARSEERGLPALVSEQVDIARRQVDYHLRRARSAAATRVPGVRTPIGPVAAGLSRAMHRMHADRSLDIVIEAIPETLAFRGEEQDLQELLGNVLDNACKWAHRHVVMRARREDGRLRITVDDDGDGIVADRRAEILGRGTRADEHVEGSGLGLAIVDELARLYGGEIHLEDSPLGGLRVQLVLPAVS